MSLDWTIKQGVCDVWCPGSLSGRINPIPSVHFWLSCILALGLCIFSDNAYLNSPYMATPYSVILGGTNNSYSFFHSQFGIRIESLNGIWTHRWLRITQQSNTSEYEYQKDSCTCDCTCKLHNTNCIDSDDTLNFPHLTINKDSCNVCNNATTLNKEFSSWPTSWDTCTLLLVAVMT